MTEGTLPLVLLAGASEAEVALAPVAPVLVPYHRRLLTLSSSLTSCLNPCSRPKESHAEISLPGHFPLTKCILPGSWQHPPSSPWLASLIGTSFLHPSYTDLPPTSAQKLCIQFLSGMLLSTQLLITYT